MARLNRCRDTLDTLDTLVAVWAPHHNPTICWLEPSRGNYGLDSRRLEQLEQLEPGYRRPGDGATVGLATNVGTWH